MHQCSHSVPALNSGTFYENWSFVARYHLIGIPSFRPAIAGASIVAPFISVFLCVLRSLKRLSMSPNTLTNLYRCAVENIQSACTMTNFAFPIHRNARNCREWWTRPSPSCIQHYPLLNYMICGLKKRVDIEGCFFPIQRLWPVECHRGHFCVHCCYLH